jgi:hypothetical protein
MPRQNFDMPDTEAKSVLSNDATSRGVSQIDARRKRISPQAK